MKNRKEIIVIHELEFRIYVIPNILTIGLPLADLLIVLR
jgi:hypothetical protein